MLKQDPGELLRRLPIICLEDTTAHPSLLPIVVWLMCAQVCEDGNLCGGENVCMFVLA
jgi:hypothetical protein